MFPTLQAWTSTGEASKFSTVTQAVSPLAGGNSEDEGKPCCENAIAHETDRKSVLACSDRFIDEQLQYGSFEDT